MDSAESAYNVNILENVSNILYALWRITLCATNYFCLCILFYVSGMDWTIFFCRISSLFSCHLLLSLRTKLSRYRWQTTQVHMYRWQPIQVQVQMENYPGTHV